MVLSISFDEYGYGVVDAGGPMNKRTRAKVGAFSAIQQRNGRYHLSQRTPHEQAIAEDIKRFGRKLEPLLPLMDQRNKL